MLIKAFLCNPIIKRDLYFNLRNKYVFLCNAILNIIYFFIVISWWHVFRRVDYDERIFLARKLFIYIFHFHTFINLLFIPLICSSLTKERKTSLWDSLIITPIGIAGLYLGKVTSYLLLVILFSIPTIPLYIILSFTGDMPFVFTLLSAFAFIELSLLSIIISFAISMLNHKITYTVVLSYFISLFLFYIPLLSLLFNVKSSIQFFLFYTSPYIFIINILSIYNNSFLITGYDILIHIIFILLINSSIMMMMMKYNGYDKNINKYGLFINIKFNKMNFPVFYEFLLNIKRINGRIFRMGDLTKKKELYCVTKINNFQLEKIQICFFLFSFLTLLALIMLKSRYTVSDYIYFCFDISFFLFPLIIIPFSVSSFRNEIDYNTWDILTTSLLKSYTILFNKIYILLVLVFTFIMSYLSIPLFLLFMINSIVLLNYLYDNPYTSNTNIEQFDEFNYLIELLLLFLKCFFSFITGCYAIISFTQIAATFVKGTINLYISSFMFYVIIFLLPIVLTIIFYDYNVSLDNFVLYYPSTIFRIFSIFPYNQGQSITIKIIMIMILSFTINLVTCFRIKNNMIN